MNKYHPHLTQEKWDKFTKFQQILSVGAEIGRAKSMIMKTHYPEATTCYFRAIELIDMIVATETWEKNLKEILRYREMLAYAALQRNTDLDLCLSLYRVLLSWDKDAIKIEIN